MTRAYYTLLKRQHSNAHWEIEFGDYYRPVVKEELRSLHEGYLAFALSNLKIIKTGETQKEIQAEVKRLNDEIDEYLDASMEIGMTGNPN